MIRDNFISKVWRNFRTIIERRRREETTVDSTRSLWTVLWMALHNKPKFMLLSLHVINCITFSCLLKYYTGWDLTVMIPTLLLYLILQWNFYKEFKGISKLQPTAPPNFNDNNGQHLLTLQLAVLFMVISLNYYFLKLRTAMVFMVTSSTNSNL